MREALKRKQLRYCRLQRNNASQQQNQQQNHQQYQQQYQQQYHSQPYGFPGVPLSIQQLKAQLEQQEPQQQQQQEEEEDFLETDKSKNLEFDAFLELIGTFLKDSNTDEEEETAKSETIPSSSDSLRENFLNNPMLPLPVQASDYINTSNINEMLLLPSSELMENIALMDTINLEEFHYDLYSSSPSSIASSC
eukprot:Awhi_evm1s5387